MVYDIAKHDGWHCFLVFHWRVDAFVRADLPSEVFVPLASRVKCGVLPITCDEGRRHMIEGRFGSGRNDLLCGSGPPKITSASSMEERTAEAKAVGWDEGVQVGVMVVFVCRRNSSQRSQLLAYLVFVPRVTPMARA